MVNQKNQTFANDDEKCESKNTDKGNINLISKVKDEDRWHQELIARLLQKSQSIECARQQIIKLIEKKNLLESKLRGKNEEISKLNDKVLLLTRELAVIKKDHVEALEEIEMLKTKVHESARKDEMLKQKKTLYKKVECELLKSDQLLVKEKLKNKKLQELKIKPHEWRTMQYTDPHYYEILQKKNFLQKELQKKLDLLQDKDNQLEQKEKLLQKLKDMLKRRPFHLLKEPNEQMIEYYRMIQFQKEKIKGLVSQVNMYETMISDRYKKLNTL